MTDISKAAEVANNAMEDGLEDYGLMIDALSARNAELEAEREQWLAAQSFTYIGKDGKPVAARDLEDERDALEKQIKSLKADRPFIIGFNEGYKTATGHFEDELAETYEIGKRDGYEEAVQHVDVLTGGDGEYFAATSGEDCPDAPAMKAKIATRYSRLLAKNAALREGRVKPLVWELWGKENGNSTVWKGYCGAQFYKVVVHHDGSGSVYDLCFLGGAYRIEADTGVNGTDYYKDVAQADFKRRILSALTTPDEEEFQGIISAAVKTETERCAKVSESLVIDAVISAIQYFSPHPDRTAIPDFREVARRSASSIAAAIRGERE